MADLIDVLSSAGLRTGEVLPRAEIHRLGKPHRAVHLYVFNTGGELLLQRRSANVDHAAGEWSISLGGHIDAGEYSGLAVRREAEEELGLRASDLRFDILFSYYQEAVLYGTYIDKQFNDVYVTWVDLTAEQISFNQTEITEIKFVPFDQFLAMLHDPAFPAGWYYVNECRDLVHFLSTHPVRPPITAK